MEIAEEVGPGWSSREESFNDLMIMNIVFDCCEHMSEPDPLLVFFLRSYDCNYSFILFGFPSPGLFPICIRAV